MEQYNKELEAVSIDRWKFKPVQDLLTDMSNMNITFLLLLTQAAAAPLPDEDDADL